MGSQADVAAAAHLPDGRGLTALRLEEAGPSVKARAEILVGFGGRPAFRR